MGFDLFKSKSHGSGGSDSDPSDLSSQHIVYNDGMKQQEDLERIHTLERVGTHAQYYEKGGLRTEGDGVDHDGSHHKVGIALGWSYQRVSHRVADDYEAIPSHACYVISLGRLSDTPVPLWIGHTRSAIPPAHHPARSFADCEILQISIQTLADTTAMYGS